MSNSLPYIILTLFILMISIFQIGLKFDERSVKFINFTVWALFILFFGCRGFIGWDWHSYYPFFKELKPLYQFDFNTKSIYDKGFVIYASIIKSFTNDYRLFIFISTLIDGILLHFAFKKHLPKNLYAFAFIMFIAMEGIILEANLMRNIKGILLFLLSIQYIEKRNILKFIILNLIGICFHWSSIIFLPLYFFIHKKIDLKIIIYIFIVGNIIYLSQLEYITPFLKIFSKYFGVTASEKTDWYFKSAFFTKQYGITLGYLEKISTSFLIMLYYNKLIEKSKVNIIFINCFLIFIIINFYFSEVSIIITRLGNLFVFSYWILWPQIIGLSTNVSKYILFIFISVYLNLRVAKTTENILFKYDNVLFDKCQNFKEREKIFNVNSLKLKKK